MEAVSDSPLPEIKEANVFDEVLEMIHSAKKPIVELGGPTPNGYQLLDGKSLTQLKEEGNQVIISGFNKVDKNREQILKSGERIIKRMMQTFGVTRDEAIQAIHSFKPKEEIKEEQPETESSWKDLRKQLNVEIDARKQPFRDNSVGGVFTSSFPHSIVFDVIPEIYRTLSPGGFWASQGVLSEEIDQAKVLGFDVRFQRKLPEQKGATVVHSVLFTKPEKVPKQTS